MSSLVFEIIPPKEGLPAALHLRPMQLQGSKVEAFSKGRSKIQWLQGAKGSEKDLLAELLHSEERFLRKEGLRRLELYLFDSFRVPLEDSTEFIKEAVAEKLLYWKGRRLFLNLFDRLSLHYEAEGMGDSFFVLGHLKGKKKSHLLEDCDYVCRGVPYWCILSGSIFFMDDEIDWKWYRKLLLGENEFSKLPEVDIPGAPSMEVLQQIFEPQEEKKEEYSPVLQLRDAHGMGADILLKGGEKLLQCLDEKSLETWEADLLETAYEKRQWEGANYYCAPSEVEEAIDFLLQLGWEIKDHLQRSVVLLDKVNLKFNIGSDQILVQGKVEGADISLDLPQVLGALGQGRSLLPLDSDKTALLSTSLKKGPLADLLGEEVVAQGVKISRKDLGLLEKLSENGNLEKSPALAALRRDLHAFQGLGEEDPGGKFLGELRPYQKRGLSWMLFLRNSRAHGILADDMGLGKTVQIFGLFSRLEGGGPHLVIAPTSLLFNWEREAKRFMPHFSVYVHHGPDRLRNAAEFAGQDLVISSYALLIRDQAFFKEVEWDCLVFDEAQRLKNPSSKGSRAAKELTAMTRLALTGTPIENKLLDLWSQFDILMPGLLGSSADFRADRSVQDPLFLARVRRKTKPFMLRRKKAEVLDDLPEKVEQNVWVEMTEEQRAFYLEFLEKARQGVLKKVQLDGMAAHRMEVFEVILRLRQICCHPHLLSSAAEQDLVPDSAKMKLLLEDLETSWEEGSKVLLFSQFTSVLDLVGSELEALGLPFLRLDGSTHNRGELVETFQESAGSQIFLISLKAGGVGLNLTAADVVILFDPWWNEAVEQQAIDRAHRIGRKGTVLAKRYLVRDSIEERMLELKEKKQGLANALTDGADLASGLSVEDLESLFT